MTRSPGGLTGRLLPWGTNKSTLPGVSLVLLVTLPALAAPRRVSRNSCGMTWVRTSWRRRPPCQHTEEGQRPAAVTGRALPATALGRPTARAAILTDRAPRGIHC